MLERKTKFYKSRNKFTLSCFLTLSFFAITCLSVYASEITAESMIELTNQSRMEIGIEKLSVNSKLSQAAYLKAGDMLEFDYFDHTSPAGVDPWHWIKLVDYNYHYAGENLAIDFITAEGTHRALMESSSHRENILNPRFSEIGVAVLSGEFEGSNSTVVVEMFAAPFNFNESEIGTSVKMENNKIESGPELELKLELKQEPEVELESESESSASPALPAPEIEIPDISKEEMSVPESTPELAIKEKPDLLAVILAEENMNLVGDYLASDLCFKDNNEFFKKHKKGAVLASADAKFLRSKGNNFNISFLSLILGADLLFSFFIYRNGI